MRMLPHVASSAGEERLAVFGAEGRQVSCRVPLRRASR